MSHDLPAAGPACPGCALGRRAFLADAALLTAVLATGWGGLATNLAATDRRAGRARGRTGSECRYPIPSADEVRIDKENQVILVRAAGFLYAFNLSCPHQNTALRWVADSGRFQCPKHKSRYQPDGSFISGRATRAMDRLAIRREADAVIVDLDRMFRQDEQQADWEAAKVAL